MATASRDSGRISRTRSSTLPSSSVRLDAGAASAARSELRVDEERRLRASGERKHFLKVKRLVLVLAPDGEQRRRGARALMGVQDAALDDGEAFGDQGLKADIVGARRDRGFDARGEQFLEQLEEAVLQRDRQGQHAVQERRDRRQFLAACCLHW